MIPGIIVFKYIFKIAHLYEFTMQQNCNPITGLFCTGEIMRDDNGTGIVLLLNIFDQVVNLFTGNWIKPGGGFIIEHNFRLEN